MSIISQWKGQLKKDPHLTRHLACIPFHNIYIYIHIYYNFYINFYRLWLVPYYTIQRASCSNFAKVKCCDDKGTEWFEVCAEKTNMDRIKTDASGPPSQPCNPAFHPRPTKLLVRRTETTHPISKWQVGDTSTLRCVRCKLKRKKKQRITGQKPEDWCTEDQQDAQNSDQVNPAKNHSHGECHHSANPVGQPQLRWSMLSHWF